MMKQVGQGTGKTQDGSAEAVPCLVKRFQEMVEAKPKSGLPIGHYAAVLGVSESRLTSHCRRIAGLSPLQIINAGVVRAAKERMRETNTAASAIAFSLGFRDPAYFSRFFRLQTGQTPTEYRTAARRESHPPLPPSSAPITACAARR